MYRRPRLVLATLPCIPVVRNHRRNPPCRRALQRINHQKQFHQMLIYRTASRLNDEPDSAAYVLLDLHIRLAIGKACDQSLSARQAKKSADLLAERLVRGSREDFEPVIDPCALRLTFGFLVDSRLFFRGLFDDRLFGSRGCNGGHSFSSQFPVRSSQAWGSSVSLLRTENWQLVHLAGPLGFEPRQSAPKALDLPLVDGPNS